MQRPARSQSPKRVGSGPSRPPISVGREAPDRATAGAAAGMSVALGVSCPPAGDNASGAGAEPGDKVRWEVDIEVDSAIFLHCNASQPTDGNSMSANTLHTSSGNPVQDGPGSGKPAVTAYGVLRLEGPDAATFLQGQVTQDVVGLPPEHWARAALCTPQGRVLALLKVVKVPTGLWLVLPEALVSAVRQHLQRFVLRTRVRLLNDDSLRAETVLAFGTTDAPAVALPVRVDGDVRVLALSPRRHLRLAPGTGAGPTSPRTAAVTDTDWLAACVEDGEPEVFPASVECWTPHMLAQDRWQAIHLHKGCYTGQEIVARTHYLGRNKRGLESVLLPDWPADAATPTPGTALDLPDGRRAEWVLGSQGTTGLHGLVVTSPRETAAP